METRQQHVYVWVAISVLIVLAAVVFAAVRLGIRERPAVTAQPGAVLLAERNITAEQLWSAYTNPMSGDAAFKGMILRVTGTITAIGELPPSITLGVAGPLGVQCVVDADDADRLPSLRKGQAISVVGACSGKAGDVMLVRCQIE